MSKLAIVDDNQEFCLVMQYFLENYFEMFTFADIGSFFETIELAQYDLVLIDYTIPPYLNQKIENGCELIRYLKKILTAPPILVLLTGWLSKYDLEEGLKICPEADSFLAKDTDLIEILNQINRLIGNR